jgi:hypothetical protein
MRTDPYEGVSAVEVLKRTPLDQLEETVEKLMKHRPNGEVRAAMVERIARVPLADFDKVKQVYLKHCGEPAK